MEFVEANLCQTTGKAGGWRLRSLCRVAFAKDWAKPLLYKAEGEELWVASRDGVASRQVQLTASQEDPVVDVPTSDEAGCSKAPG